MQQQTILDQSTDTVKAKSKKWQLVLFYCWMLLPLIRKLLWHFIMNNNRTEYDEVVDVPISPEGFRLMTTIRIIEVLLLFVFIVFGFWLTRKEHTKLHRNAITIFLIMLVLYFIINVSSLAGLAGLYLNGTL